MSDGKHDSGQVTTGPTDHDPKHGTNQTGTADNEG